MGIVKDLRLLCCVLDSSMMKGDDSTNGLVGEVIRGLENVATRWRVADTSLRACGCLVYIQSAFGDRTVDFRKERHMFIRDHVLSSVVTRIRIRIRIIGCEGLDRIGNRSSTRRENVKAVLAELSINICMGPPNSRGINPVWSKNP